MAYAVGIVLFALGLLASIALHEVGHLVPAKRFGVRCTQYMVGFGPTVWSRRFGDTEYGLKGIPLGGYVRMLGMFPPKPGRPARADSTGRLGTLIDQARHDAQLGIEPQDADRLFYQRSVPKRLVIMFGGPVMNLVIAMLIFAGTAVTYGVQADTGVSSISQCVLPITAAPDATCSPGDPQAPALAAGIRPGDVIVAFDGRRVQSWDEVRTAIRANSGTPVTLTVERAGATIDLQATPLVDARQALDDQGNPIVGPDGTPATEQVGFLGILPGFSVVDLPGSQLPGYLGSMIWRNVEAVAQLPSKVGTLFTAAAGGERDPQGPIGVVGVTRLAGEIASSPTLGTAGMTSTDRFMWGLSLLASLNMALFVFNLVPLLPLDGGHIAGAIWEGLRRQVARLRKRPDPGPVDVARALPLAYGVASVLFAFSLMLIFLDIFKPITLGG